MSSRSYVRALRVVIRNGGPLGWRAHHELADRELGKLARLALQRRAGSLCHLRVVRHAVRAAAVEPQHLGRPHPEIGQERQRLLCRREEAHEIQPDAHVLFERFHRPPVSLVRIGEQRVEPRLQGAALVVGDALLPRGFGVRPHSRIDALVPEDVGDRDAFGPPRDHACILVESDALETIGNRSRRRSSGVGRHAPDATAEGNFGAAASYAIAGATTIQGADVTVSAKSNITINSSRGAPFSCAGSGSRSSEYSSMTRTARCTNHIMASGGYPATSIRGTGYGDTGWNPGRPPAGSDGGANW